MAISLWPANKTDEISWAWAAKGSILQYEAGRQEEAIAAFDRALEIASKKSSEIVSLPPPSRAGQWACGRGQRRSRLDRSAGDMCPRPAKSFFA